MIDIVIRVVIGIALFCLAIIDLMKKEIPTYLIITLGVVAVIGRIMISGIPTTNIFKQMMSLSIGMSLLGISFLTKEKIGYGDGLTVLALGLFLSSRQLIWMLFYASLIMAAVSAFLIITKKGKRDSKLAFIPAIFLGYIFV